jgi:starch phosphorylase
LRPLEASGTSGMKALANGGLNLSILDGWWDEAWRPETADQPFVGWAIGRGEKYDNQDYQDQVESLALYEILEHDVIPAFYERGADGLPRRWIARMKSSIATLCPEFNMQRMVTEYATDFYLRSHERHQHLMADNAAAARALAAWNQRIRANWGQVAVESVDALPETELRSGGEVEVRARVRLGALDCDEVSVELYLGMLDADFEICDAAAVPMEKVSQAADGVYVFAAHSAACRESGMHGYTVRVLPYHVDEPQQFLPGLIHWASA